jgi:hypothetical protein
MWGRPRFDERHFLRVAVVDPATIRRSKARSPCREFAPASIQLEKACDRIAPAHRAMSIEP